MADGYDRSLPDIDVLVAGIVGQHRHQVYPLVPGDFDDRDVGNHVGARVHDHRDGISQSVKHVQFDLLLGTVRQRVPEAHGLGVGCLEPDGADQQRAG